MDLEFVGLYPCYGKKGKEFVGSCHVYEKNSKQDIRGIKIFFKKNNVFVTMPCSRGYDYEDKKAVRYPVIAFGNKADTDYLISFVKDHAKKEFKNFDWPKNFPKNFSEYQKLIRDCDQNGEIKPTDQHANVYVRK